jgi:hypothetical protein
MRPNEYARFWNCRITFRNRVESWFAFVVGYETRDRMRLRFIRLFK